jgi:hypothetical protein
MSFKAFSEIKQEDADEVVELIKSLTGAKAVVMIISEHEIPCDVNKEFGSCSGNHLTHLATSGIDPNQLTALLLQSAEAYKKTKI